MIDYDELFAGCKQKLYALWRKIAYGFTPKKMADDKEVADHFVRMLEPEEQKALYRALRRSVKKASLRALGSKETPSEHPDTTS
jgi:hypothetical protein